MRVTRAEPVLVHAAGDVPAADEYYFLSNLDQNVAVLMKTVHVFSPSRARDDAAAVIMDALGRVLVHYYPFQGSLVVSADDGRLSVRNDRRGVPFVVADADCELKEVGDVVLSAPDAAAVQEQLVFVGRSNSEEKEDDELGAPLLSVQVTRFRCGGFVLGLAMNHCLADGVAAAEFLRSWAEMARGVPLSSPPFLDRTVLRARTSPTVAFPHEEFAEMEDVSGLAGLREEPRVHRAFAIDADRLARLKRQACACSTFVALTAFVWRATSRAMRMRPEQKSKLMFAVDGRWRVDPPLPRGFCGNAVVFACCVSTAGDLLGGPVSAAARWIQDAIRRTADAFIRSAIDYVEVDGGRAPSMTATTLVTAWNRLGFHAADFGWGEAAQSGPAELPRGEVVMFMRDVRDGSIVVLLGLPRSCMQEFQDMVDLI
ncbi:fatty alcohol:caffeoyl-CoA acyltransferase-like [Aegilops tauschii subsp. strangulata]|uniref:Taxadien-5-alpha-ol O-acetyltransferase n=1 Tax=Aegilops tauschii TaxID=37682 RepID=M8BN27_AEGTA|nr:fatty alcohol:caffeoyl-CoA acyltransferase-like [Aegilops tauschii subsp. strangulata]